jgi:NMD protein affecting ribosome stability and mRNA decay
MEQMVKCANCGTSNPPGQQFCGKCGAKLATEAQSQKIKCPNCGFMNIPGQQFCGSCGARLVSVVHQAPAVSTQQVSSMPAQEVTTVPPPQMPARVTKPAVPLQQVDTKPTWGLAWGLWWRMLVLSILIFGVIYAVFAIVMVLAFNYKLPPISGG